MNHLNRVWNQIVGNDNQIESMGFDEELISIEENESLDIFRIPGIEPS